MDSSSHFLGYIPMTSGVMAAATSIGNGSVSSVISMTASLSIDADTGSMHMSETLFPNGNASILSPVRAM